MPLFYGIFRATLEEARCRELLLQNDLFLKYQQAVWQAVALRGCFVSVESRRKSWAGRSQWVGQDNAIPDGGRRGNSRRGRGLCPQEVDDRLLSPGRRGNAGPFGAGRSDRR